MNPRILYVLSFKSEPLIKIGVTTNANQRLAALGRELFSLSESYCVTATDSNVISLLERNLHVIFAEHRATAAAALSSGHTEIFRASILPKVLHTIDVFKGFFAHAEIRVERGVSAPVPKRVSWVQRKKSSKKTHLHISPTKIHGEPYWQLTIPRAEGGRDRKTFKSKADAEQALAKVQKLLGKHLG